MLYLKSDRSEKDIISTYYDLRVVTENGTEITDICNFQVNTDIDGLVTITLTALLHAPQLEESK